jgi:hypothetical protein
MTAHEASGSKRLQQLLISRSRGEIDYQAFCDAFEHAYNFEVRPEDLTPKEDSTFRVLFDVVTWFTGNRSARGELATHFKTESDVDAAVKRALQELGTLDEHGSQSGR